MDDVRNDSYTGAEALVAFCICLAIVLALTGWASPGAAQSGDPATGKVETFREHVARGAKLRKEEKHRQALEHFDAARKIADHPKLMYVTGQLREAIGDCPGARDDYLRAGDDKRASAKLADKLEQSLENNKLCKSWGQLTLDCEPANAGARAGKTELSCGQPIKIEAGKHTLVASAPGYRDLQMTVTIEPGSDLAHELTLTEIPPGETPRVEVPRWMTYSAYAGMGTGAALIFAGVISDAGAPSRQEDLHQAHTQGQSARTNRLVDEAESARTRTALLYTSGVLLAAGGTLLWVYDEEAALWIGGNQEASVQPEVSVSADGASLGATIRW